RKNCSGRCNVLPARRTGSASACMPLLLRKNGEPAAKTSVSPSMIARVSKVSSMILAPSRASTSAGNAAAPSSSSPSTLASPSAPSAPTRRSVGACARTTDAVVSASSSAISARSIRSIPAHRAAHLALGIAFLHVLTLVVHLRAACKSQCDLDVAALRVQIQCHESQPLLLCCPDQPAQFPFREQQLARPRRVEVPPVRGVVGRHVHAVQPCLAVVDARERLGQAGLAVTDRFHFGAGQHEARLEALHDVIFVQRLPVPGERPLFGSVGHGRQSSGDGLPQGVELNPAAPSAVCESAAAT